MSSLQLIILPSLMLKPGSVAHLWIGEDLLYAAYVEHLSLITLAAVARTRLTIATELILFIDGKTSSNSSHLKTKWYFKHSLHN